MRSTTRRTFLAGALAGGLTACLADTALARTRPTRSSAISPVDVIVIGAGLSGLNAALLLQGQGARVTVIEASKRIGGRVHSADDTRLRPEYGASQIGRSYARVISTANRLGVALVPEDRDLLPFAAHLQGRWIKSADWPSSDLNPLPEALRSTPLSRVSNALLAQFNPLQAVEDWLDPRFADLDVSLEDLFKKHQVPQQVIDLASLSAPSMSAVSALALMQEATRGQVDRAFGGMLPPVSNIKDGTSRLTDAMAAALARPVQRGLIAASIDMSRGKARVGCLDGTMLTADFVIAAIPFTQLKSIDVRPNLTGVQRIAVDTLATLGTTRAYLAIREPFWQVDGLDPSFASDGPIEMFWAIDNHQGSGECRGMMVITGERAARLDGVPPAEVPEFLLRELTRLRPASQGKVEVLTWNSWSATPLIGCCRHIYGPGQLTRFARPMIEPWQRLHFAGEHTRRNDFGMEAAMESGERAALEVLTASA